MRSLIVLFLVATSLEAILWYSSATSGSSEPRQIEFVNNCGGQIRVIKQSSIISSESEVATLEAGQSYTGSFPLGVVATSFTNGASGLTQVSFRSFLVDRFEIDIRKGFDTAVKVEASGDNTVLTCADVECAGTANVLDAVAQEVPYTGSYKITFCSEKAN